MISRNYLPHLVQCRVTAARDTLDVTAKRSEDGKTLVLQAVNPTEQPVAAQVRLAGFVPSRPSSQVTELSAPLEAKNPAAQPEAATPRQREWTHGLKHGDTRYTFPPHSVTVIRSE
jgi:alpha-L-arabinofuranosidase